MASEANRNEATASHEVILKASTVFEMIQKVVIAHEITTGKKPKFIILDEGSVARLKHEFKEYQFEYDDGKKEIESCYGLQIVKVKGYEQRFEVGF